MTTLSPHSAAQLQDLLKTKKAEEPKKAWRNRWLLEHCLDWMDGTRSEPGEYEDMDDWPSREIAEQKAEELLYEMDALCPEHGIIHRGAFPIE